MHKNTYTLLALASLGLLSSCSAVRVDKAAQVASGFTSHLLCDGAFVSGRSPEQVYAEMVRPMPGMGLVNWGLHYQVDMQKHEVATDIAGLFPSRALYREHLGCTVMHGDETLDASAPAPLVPTPAALLLDIATTDTPSNPRLQAALARAVVEQAGPPLRHTKAVLVLRDGKTIAEQYAKGYDANTPLLGFSMTKSVMNALLGILVRQGRLKVDQPAPIAAWQDSGDPRHAITIDQLLRQTTGLDLPQTNSGFDPSSQIMFIARDKAAASAAAPLASPPGTRWRYSDTNYLLLSRIVRDAVGGRAGDVLNFANKELFGPLGMQHVTLDFDATGTPMGAANMLASAHDWARFGLLYLNDGMAGGQRILPAGWVQYSVTPTLSTGYGAGFWTNRVPGNIGEWGVAWGLAHAPQDAYFARGFMGQFIAVIPSERLVVVRLSVSHVRGDDIEETDRIVADVLAALHTAS